MLVCLETFGSTLTNGTVRSIFSDSLQASSQKIRGAREIGSLDLDKNIAK